MKTARLALAAALALLPLVAAPADAPRDGWTGTFSFWAGVSRYDVLDLGQGMSAADGKDLLSGNFDTIGGAVVLHHYAWEFGALYEGTLMQKGAQSQFYTPVFGLGFDITDNVRLEVLGELGGHRISQIGAGNDRTLETRAVWLPFVGLRPGVAYRIPLDDVRLVLALSPFARWDLQRRIVEVRAAVAPVSYEAGGTAVGIVAAIGLEL